MEKSVTCDESLKAEILWALKAIMSHYSYKSCEGMSKLFQVMFPDSRIASQFSCGEPLLLSASGARQKYSSYLDEQKRKKTSEGVELKRKELVNELDELKKKRRRLETDVDGLVKSADEFAQKAEDTGELVWITKSNSLRRTAKEKFMTRKDIEDKIANVVDELKKTDFHLSVSSAQSLLIEKLNIL